MGVRFISINDGYDSDDYKGTTGGLEVVMRSIIYAAYSKDLSVKTTSAKIQMMKQGKYVGGYAPYGYVLHPTIRNKLAVDPEAADVIRRIFREALEGSNTSQIARSLNDDGIPTPGQYFKSKHPDKKKFSNMSEKISWETVMVYNILKNLVYTGTLVSRKMKSCGVGSKKRVVNEPIRECVLDEVVLEDLRRVTAMARERPEEFAAYIGSKQSAEIQREIRRQEKELAAMRKQKAELDAIFKKLYEDSVLSRITTEQFQMLSSSYTEEQNQIAAGIPQKEADIQRLRETVSGTDGFLDKAKRYMDITELTPELLRLFIEKIVVHEKEVKWSKHAPQTVEIYYNGIGFIDKQHQDMESLQPLKTEEPRQAS